MKSERETAFRRMSENNILSDFIFNAYFNEIIIEKKINKQTLGILTGNLFLSMLPLHLDNKKRIFVLGLMGGIFINGYPIKKVFL